MADLRKEYVRYVSECIEHGDKYITFDEFIEEYEETHR